MKSYLKKMVNGCLRPFNLMLIRVSNNTLAAANLFDDLKLIIDKDSPVCLDVGANRGQTIDFLQKIFKNPIIYAFEPSAKIFKFLKTKKFSDNVFLYNVALGETRQKREFFNYKNSYLSSFLPLDSCEENRFRSVGLDCKEIVEVDTVDRFLNQQNINKVDLLKIDTQGFDLEVLLGAKEALRKGVIRNVLVELNFVRKYEGQSMPEDINNLLKENNFSLIDYYEKVRQDKTLAWASALFKS